MTTRFIRIAAATALAALALPALADAALDRGAYLARIMDCGGCHTPTGPDMAPDETRFLAGGAFGFGLPGLGVFYPPNLTPDMETGLGAWSAAEIVAALRTGVRPDGRELAPIMPWRSYAAITDEDAQALARYLKSLTPIVNAVPGPVADGAAAPAPYLAMVLPH